MTYIFWSLQKSFNKFLASLPGTNLVFGGSVENFYDLHILVFAKISQQDYTTPSLNINCLTSSFPCTIPSVSRSLL